MNARPNVYDGEAPFLLIHESDRDEAVRFFASANVHMIISSEGTSLTKVELMDCDRTRALRLVEQLMRRSRVTTFVENDEAVSSRDESPSDIHRFYLPNRLRARGLLED